MFLERTKIVFIFVFLQTGLSQIEAKRDYYMRDSGPPESGGPDNTKGETEAQVLRCRHNYHETVERGLNRQINTFLQAGFIYQSMSQYFGRCDIALPGFSKFFLQMAKEQHEKVESLHKYQNLRGGTVLLQAITTPATAKWGTGLEAMNNALEIEKSINSGMLELHSVCSRFNDPHCASFIQIVFLGPQVEKIYTLSQYISNLERVGPGIGEYLFDKLPQT